ncbi:MAG: tetratricopeptide repeat protein, partial [Acidobacteriota bacterium]|nr:tetratricopeptide repeat protein [Acidobacteriota bacterium]
LPFGVTRLRLVWVVLLWAYCSLGERLVLILVLLLVGSVPFLLPVQRQQVALALSPPVRAVTAVEESRLYGRLFSDFSVLGRVQGDNPAVHHLLADLHRRLGQWELARSSYLDLVEREPENAPALINLGIYFYNQEDFGRAAAYFGKAAEADPESAVAYFNLSQAFSSGYLYDDSRRALQQAQQLKSKEVGQWIQEAVAVEVRPVDGGVARLAEIKDAMGSEQGATESGVKGRVLRHGLTLFVAVGVLLMAAALYLARRGGGLSTPSSGPRNGGDTGDLLLRVLIPGLPSAREGSGAVAYLAWVPPVALLLLPFSTTWGYAVPWGFDPGGMLTKLIATVGLVVFLLLRLVQQNRGG